MNVYTTLSELLKDRNYDLQSDITTNSDFSVKHKLNGNELFVVFSEENKIGINYLKQIINNTDNHFLIIYNNTITSFAKQYIESIKNKIEFFTYEELQRNITKHHLVPKHYILTNEEKNHFLKDMKVNTKHFPKCKITDPISKYYGCNIGDIMKIIRNDDNIQTVYYRIVST